MSRPLSRCVLLAMCLIGIAPYGFGQCANPATASVALELDHPAIEGQPVVLRLSDYYPSGAQIGTAQAVVIGTHVDITQVNDVAPTLPTTTCRVQLLNIGPLPPGTYSAIWTTTEHVTIPYPSTTTRVRTLPFVVLPASAVPAAGGGSLVLLIATLAFIALLRLART